MIKITANSRQERYPWGQSTTYSCYTAVAPQFYLAAAVSVSES
ncbi:MAG: hypothetical protein ACTMUB_03445 [cyanobacterium endosymbiont of Rhopalodia musculus]|nr:hypothetical protein [cyanobacterium endosymbiont of Epithemia clementina EcSB]WGT67256.1 hypothetical protein P3F56_08595 [cyanobacterium endosymbiont of Epithemia clementina EcSB]